MLTDVGQRIFNETKFNFLTKQNKKEIITPHLAATSLKTIMSYNLRTFTLIAEKDSRKYIAKLLSIVLEGIPLFACLRNCIRK